MSLPKYLHFGLFSLSVTNLCREYSLYFTGPSERVQWINHTFSHVFDKCDISFINHKTVITRWQGHWNSGCGSKRAKDHETEFSFCLTGEEGIGGELCRTRNTTTSNSWQKHSLLEDHLFPIGVTREKATGLAPLPENCHHCFFCWFWYYNGYNCTLCENMSRGKKRETGKQEIRRKNLTLRMS